MSQKDDLNFQKCISIIFANEGGYSDHPNDKGGATNMGITSGTLSSAYKKNIVNHNNIKQLTKMEAQEIYYQMYWLAGKCADPYMYFPLCLIHFDSVVNHGVGGGGKLLQKALNDMGGCGLSVDGAVGKLSLDCLKKVVTKSFDAFNQLGIKYNFHRGALYDSIIARDPSQSVFRKGWTNRLNHMKALWEQYVESAKSFYAPVTPPEELKPIVEPVQPAIDPDDTVDEIPDTPVTPSVIDEVKKYNTILVIKTDNVYNLYNQDGNDLICKVSNIVIT